MPTKISSFCRKTAEINGAGADDKNGGNGVPVLERSRSHAFAGNRRKIQTDGHNDGAGHNRRHQFFNPADADHHNEEAD